MIDNKIAGSGGVVNPLFEGTNYISQIQSTSGGSDFLGAVVPKVIGALFAFGAVAFMFILIIGAISWILSGGDKAHVEAAKGRITSAIVGIILLLSSFVIIKLVEIFFNINILSIDIGPLIIQ